WNQAGHRRATGAEILAVYSATHRIRYRTVSATQGERDDKRVILVLSWHGASGSGPGDDDRGRDPSSVGDCPEPVVDRGVIGRFAPVGIRRSTTAPSRSGRAHPQPSRPDRTRDGSVRRWGPRRLAAVSAHIAHHVSGPGWRLADRATRLVSRYP